MIALLSASVLAVILKISAKPIVLRRGNRDLGVEDEVAGPGTILLPALGLAFAAFCVWLTVRIINRRERWAKWTAVGVLTLLAYPLSFGPLVWLDSRELLPQWAMAAVQTYAVPLDWLGERSTIVTDGYRWYAGFWRSTAPRFRKIFDPPPTSPSQTAP